MSLARILICAGSDSGGGAGIQADIKTVTALGGFAMTAITALTAQNTLGVQGVFPVPADFIRQQLRSVLDDLGADAAKTGMLGDAAAIDAIAATLPPGLPLVVDPVMIAKGGASLLAEAALGALKQRLIPRATLLTPNLLETEALLGRRVADVAAMQAAGADLLALGAQAVLVKGGHLEGDRLFDVLVGPEGVEIFEGTRIPTQHTHGTGCTLASAIATGLGQWLGLSAAVARARIYLIEAIRTAPGLGHGHGPLNHGHPLNR